MTEHTSAPHSNNHDKLLAALKAIVTEATDDKSLEDLMAFRWWVLDKASAAIADATKEKP